MKETLVCSSCTKTWKREVARGRKPVMCPKCIKIETVTKEKILKAKEKVIAKKNAVKTKTENLSVRKEVKTEDTSVATTKRRKIAAVEVQQMTICVEEVKVNENKLSLADVYEDYYPHPANYKEFIESTKGGSVWDCPTCKKVVKLEVPLVVPPTHRCPQNSTKVKEYQRVK